MLSFILTFGFVHVLVCLTIQQVSGAQVYVDAGMEAGDEAVESSLLYTLT